MYPNKTRKVRQEEVDEDAPLIHSISKLRALRFSRQEIKGPTKAGNSVGAVDKSASRTTDISY